MFKKTTIAVILCMAVLMSVVAPAVYAADRIVEIDTGGLWDDDIFDDGDTDIGDDTEDETDDTAGSGSNNNNNTHSGRDDAVIIPDKPSTGSGSGSSSKPSSGSSSGSSSKPASGGSLGGGSTGTGSSSTTTTPTTPTTPTVTVNFSDVTKDKWFYNDVVTLAGMGVINGYPGNIFLPDNHVTRAEFLKLIISLMVDETFTTYDQIFDDVPLKEWYADYITTAIVYGIIDIKEYGSKFEPDKPITRREVAKIVVSALQVEAGGFKTPYVDTADHNITCLYGLGLMQGNVDPKTGYRYFYPDTQISRAETAAVILRIYKLSVEGAAYAERFMKENNMPPLQSLYVPTTKNDFYNVLTNAWDKNQAFVVYNYDFGPGSEQMRVLTENINDAYNTCSVHHPELATFVTMKIATKAVEGGSEVTLSFVPENEGACYDSMISERKAAEAIAGDIVSKMFTGNENGIERADIIHDYIAEILEYDYEYDDTAYTAYGALSTGKAVCQGYSALFNMMCKLAGVNSLAVANDNHMWNIVLAGNKLYHYDVTASDVDDHRENIFKGVEEMNFTKNSDYQGYSLPCLDMFF